LSWFQGYVKKSTGVMLRAKKGCLIAYGLKMLASAVQLGPWPQHFQPVTSNHQKGFSPVSAHHSGQCAQLTISLLVRRMASSISPCAAILSSLTLCAYSWSVVFLPGRFWLSDGSTGSLGFPNAGSRVLHASVLYLPVVFGTMLAWKA
jgi:hypothetical protein